MKELQISYAVGPDRTRENFVWVSEEVAEVLCNPLIKDPWRYRDTVRIYLEAGEYLETGYLVDIAAFDAEDAEKVFPVSYRFGDDE